MWYLAEQKEPLTASPRYWLGGINGGGRTIGRKHVDIRLKASSVSRNHASITVLKSSFYSPSNRRHHSTAVSVQDSSAYGTFLKYPPGHSSNRAQRAVGHHRRLDKDTPVEICEGALLAFGAPSAWWKLGWFHVLLVTSRISSAERDRIMSIVASTGVEVSENWGEGATHLVTTESCTSSSKFMMALVQGKSVVTPAWVEALRHTVTECCRAINEAPNDDTAAKNACAIADEKHFIPPFSKADVAAFQPEHLVAVFGEDTRERRKNLFKGIVIAFGREERRSRWAAIVELLGGRAMLSKVIGSTDRFGRVVYVQGEHGNSRRPYEDIPGRAYIQEADLTSAIIRADLAPLIATTEGKVGAAELADVATPGPLDGESDVDTDDESEAVASVRKHAEEQARDLAGKESLNNDFVDELGKTTGEGIKMTSAAGYEKPAKHSYPEKNLSAGAQNSGARKRARVSSDNAAPERASRDLKKRQESKEFPIVSTSDRKADKEAVVENEAAIGNSDLNERVFFKVENVGRSREEGGVNRQDGDMPKARLSSVRRDVRRFRRRRLPSASTMPLRRVRYTDKLESGLDRTPAEVEAYSHGMDETAGAQVVESERK